MEKLVYVVAGSPSRTPVALHEVLISDATPRLVACGAWRITVSITDPELHAHYLNRTDLSGAVATATPAVGAVVELWIECVDDHAPITATLTDAGLDVAGYLVTESVPVPQPRTWALADPAPGVSLVTTIDKPASLDEAAFFAHWTTVHTPLSVKWHPLVGYVRNHVVRAITGDAPSCAGIVSESFANADDLLVPDRFLGAGDDGIPLVDRVAAMTDDVRAFLDLDRCFPFAMRQYRATED
jgi:hypothetical protein